MPAYSVRDEYAQWMATAPTVGLLMQAVHLQWGGGAENYHMGNHILSPTVVTYENGAQVNLAPVQFECSQPDRSGTTESTVRLQAPMGGDLFNLFQYLRGYQAANIGYLLMYVRYFILPNALYAPMSYAPERYFVTSITYGYRNITIEASMARLPRYRAGIPYTVDEYPGLYEF